MTTYQNDCLSIDGLQSVILQISVLLKIYVDIEYNLESVESYDGSYTKKYHGHIPCSFPYKHVCVDDKFTRPIAVFRGENAAYEFIKAILKQYEYCKKIMKKHVTKI